MQSNEPIYEFRCHLKPQENLMKTQETFEDMSDVCLVATTTSGEAMRIFRDSEEAELTWQEMLTSLTEFVKWARILIQLCSGNPLYHLDSP